MLKCKGSEVHVDFCQKNEKKEIKRLRFEFGVSIKFVFLFSKTVETSMAYPLSIFLRLLMCGPQRNADLVENKKCMLNLCCLRLYIFDDQMTRSLRIDPEESKLVENISYRKFRAVR